MSEYPRLDAGELLASLIHAQVRFVVIGGLAAQVHGSPILTADVDVCPAVDRSNLERLATALASLAAMRRDTPSDVHAPVDLRALRAGDMFILRTRFGDLDILMHPDPGLDYEVLEPHAISAQILGVTVRVASLDDLVAMKRAAGRPKDLLMLEHLGALREEIDRRVDL